MAKICILSALLLQLLYTLVQGQNSPCPDHFTYIKKPGSDETIGLIEIRDPSINNLEVHLKIDVKVPTQLPTSFVGGVNLTKPEENAARDVLEGRSLLYYIYFPVQNPLPTVHRIWFNNDQICSGSEVSGKVVTTISLEYTLKIIIQPLQNQTNPAPPQNRPAEQKPPRPSQQAPQPTPSAHVNKIENYNECGLRFTDLRERNPFLSQAVLALPGEWPWVAAIFRVTHEYEFLCGGTILTTKHILTAAHCLKMSQYINETIPANILTVALGRYNLTNFNEEGSVNVDVARYIFHPEYQHSSSSDADLATLILVSPVEFTAFIRPICLPSSIDFRRLEQNDGNIVGWGVDEYGNHNTEEPWLATMPIVQTDVCLRSDPILFFITSERTLCAGGPNLTNSGACSVDSGSGLVIFDSTTGHFQLRGVVSRAPRSNQPFCDQTQYIVFIDVFKHLNWINQQNYST